MPQWLACMTIFITSFHTLISRNILHAGLLERLTARGVRTVLLVPRAKQEYFRKAFSGLSVFVEGVDTRLTARDLFFRRLVLAFTRTASLSIKKRALFHADRKVIPFIGFSLPALLFGNARWSVRLLQRIDAYTDSAARFRDVFARHAPALVFSTDVQNELDVSLVHAAQKRGIPAVAMVRSWDNLSSKGVLRSVPDALIVQNELLAEEARRLSHIPRERIRVIGIPHYDRYLAFRAALGGDPDGRAARRAAFFARHGFDPGKRLVLFAPMGDRYLRDNKTDKHALECLSALDLNMLVRLPPGDVVNFEGFKSKGARVTFQKTGVSEWEGGPKLNEISLEDDAELAEALEYADLVAAGATTVVVDACLFDKPVIAVAFDFEPRAYWDSIRRYYGYDHFQPITRSGGVRFAETPDELLSCARAYLSRPLLDREGRAVVRNEQMHVLDGGATARLAEALLGAI